MRATRAPGRINVRFLLILVGIVVLLAGGGAGAYKLRSRMIANKALAAGKAALERKDWAEATQQLQQYLSRHSEDPEMLRSYAEANLAMRPLEPVHLKAAADAYRILFRRLGDTPSGKELTHLYFKLGEYNDAAYICRQRVERDPKDLDAKLGLAQALIGQRRLPEAVTELVDLLKREPSEPQGYAMLYEILREQGTESLAQQVRQALALGGEATTKPVADVPEGLLDAALKRCPDAALLHALRAQHFYARATQPGTGPNPEARQADLKLARAELETADRLPATDLDLQLRLLRQWLELGDVAKAEAHLATLEHLDAVSLRAQGIYSEDELKRPRVSAAALFFIERCAKNLLPKPDRKPTAMALIERARHELSAADWMEFTPLAVQLCLLGDDLGGARKILDEAYAAQKAKPTGQDTNFGDKLSYLEARLATVKGDYYAVINWLEPLVARHPGYVDAWDLLAQAYLKTNQVARALNASQEVSQSAGSQASSDIALKQRLLDICLSQRNFKEAQRLAQELKAAAAGNPALQLYLLKAEMLTTKELSPQALTAWTSQLEQLAQAQPGISDVRVLQAMLELHQGRMDEAIARLTKAIQECPDSLQASLVLADLFAARPDDRPKAIEVCTAAVAKYPQLAAPRVALARCQITAEQKPQAQATLEKAVAELSGEEKDRAALVLASMLFSGPEPAKGLEFLRRLAEQDAANVNLQLQLLSRPEVQTQAADRQAIIAHIKAAEGERGLRWRFEQAKADLQVVRDEIKAPKEMVSAREKDITSLLRYCIDADAQWPEPVATLGAMCELLGKVDQAEEAYRRLLSNRPGEPTVTGRLLSLLQGQGRTEEAEDLLKKTPESLVAADDRLGQQKVEIAWATGNKDRAIAALDDLVSSRPKDIRSRILRARYLVAQRGDLDRAMKLLDEAQAVIRESTANATATTNADRTWFIDLYATKVLVLHARGQDAEAMAMLDREVETRKDFQASQLRGMFHVTLRQYDEAEKDFTHLTEFAGDVPRGHELLGMFYVHRKDLDKALTAWEQGLKAKPEDTRLKALTLAMLLDQPAGPLRQRGRTIIEALPTNNPGHPDPAVLTLRAFDAQGPAQTEAIKLAIAAWEQVLQSDLHNLQAHRWLIQLAVTLRDSKQIRARMSQAISANPKHVPLLLLVANIELQMRDYTAATSHAETILRLDPDNLDGRHLLIRLALQSRLPAVAEAQSKKALELAPQNETTQLLAATVQRALRRTDQAIAVLEAFRATPEGQKSLQTLLVLADLYMEQKNMAKAGAVLEAAEKMAPTDLGVLQARFNAMAAQGHTDQLLATVNERIKDPAQKTGVLITAGTALCGTEQPAQWAAGVKLLQQAAEADPKNAGVQTMYAEAAFKIGQYDQAIAAFRAALAENPKDPGLLNSLAWTLGMLANQPDEALTLANQAVDIDPDDPHLLDTRGAILAKKEKWEDARRDLERCLAARLAEPGTRVSALKSLITVLTKQKQNEEAQKRVAQFLQADDEKHELTPQQRQEVQALLASPPK